MTNFINTADKLGDEVTLAMILEGTITEFKDDTLETVGSYAFDMCTLLTDVEIPNVTSLGTESFGYSGVTKLKLPRVEEISDAAFQYCKALRILDFTIAKKIGGDVCRRGCDSLIAFILRNTDTVATLGNAQAFANNCPIATYNGTGYIYVPRTLVESYKAATNWSIYANQFRALEDYTVDGTTTGELDESKI